MLLWPCLQPPALVSVREYVLVSPALLICVMFWCLVVSVLVCRVLNPQLESDEMKLYSPPERYLPGENFIIQDIDRMGAIFLTTKEGQSDLAAACLWSC